MRIHVLQHVPFENEAWIGHWALEKKHSLTRTALYTYGELPALSEVDWLVVMGGPMGAYDEDKHSWLTEEKRYLEKALGEGKTVLGICLGAQIMAHVLGAEVRKNIHREIGWFPVERTTGAGVSPFAELIPERFTAFHWHGDTFGIPEGAVPFARSEACENQGFLYGKRAWALQFHLESTRESINKLIHNSHEDLMGGEFVQSEKEIRGGFSFLEGSNALMKGILERIEQDDEH